MNFDNDKIPTDLHECFDILREIMHDSEEGEWFKSASEDDAIVSTHHGLGQWIRNTWKLWDKKSTLYDHLKRMGLWNADDMSSFILKSYHRLINGKELDLGIQIDEYINYWKEYEEKFGPLQNK